ncbi:hypothetical protein RRG08_041605 [Elysia crispata]|uniref:Uncharacterized protein n=1 Tax=Elysia crispata TaxID=231223 RepID=A0AAE1E6Q8_9GAST|nr:hypothetical protein RRG08_041605 [Elysia crispata]
MNTKSYGSGVHSGSDRGCTTTTLCPLPSEYFHLHRRFDQLTRLRSLCYSASIVFGIQANKNEATRLDLCRMFRAPYPGDSGSKQHRGKHDLEHHYNFQ